MQELVRKAKKTFFALKEKGIWFTYNLWWLSTFYSYTDNFLRNLMYLKIYPFFKRFPSWRYLFLAWGFSGCLHILPRSGLRRSVSGKWLERL